MLLASSAAFAQGQKVSRSSVGMKGTSTLHNWSATVGKVRGTADIRVEGTTLKSINSLSVTMDVNSIKSDKGSTMDRNIQNTMNASKHSTITYQLKSVSSLTQQAGGWQAVTKGSLTMNGVTKTVDLTVAATVAADGSIRFKGTKKMKMTEFSITPPVLFLGTLKTSDDVTLSLDVTFAK